MRHSPIFNLSPHSPQNIFYVVVTSTPGAGVKGRRPANCTDLSVNYTHPA